MKITVGCATYDEYESVYFTVQALRLYHDMTDVEILVVDNFGCDHTQEWLESWVPNARYIRSTQDVGTAAPRNRVFAEASGDVVVCIDCHVLLVPGALDRLRSFYGDHPDCADLIQGPMLYDDYNNMATHFEPVWRDHMWGIWGDDARGHDRDGQPFEIQMHGLGLFCCRRDAWLGFNARFSGFGGEEGYIHEKYRQAGRKCLCAPWLRWVHRFTRPFGVPYPLTLDDRVRNYLIGHTELGLDIQPVLDHFAAFMPAGRLAELVIEAAG